MSYFNRRYRLAELALVFLCAAGSAPAEALVTTQEGATRIEALYRESYTLEERGDYEEAKSVATQIMQQSDSYDARLRYAWLTLQSGHYEEAAEAYRRVLELAPQSQDGQLGLQLAYISAERWNKAEDVGRELLEQAPKNYYALSRHAFVRFVQGAYEDAEDLYRKALAVSEDDPEMLLGLGFTRIRRGDAEQGEKLCRQAAAHLTGDPRVERCLEEARLGPTRKPLSFYGGAYASYFGYTDPWALRDIKSLTAHAGIEADFGLGLNVGAAHSQTTLRYVKNDFSQTVLLAGLFFKKDTFRVDGAAGLILSNASRLDQTFLGTVSGRVLPGRVGGSLSATGTFYEGFPVFQIDPRLIAVIGDHVRLAVGPELIIAPEADRLDWSGHVGMDIAWSDAFSSYLRGYGGYRRYAVDLGGLSVWTDDDRFFAGYAAGTRWSPTPNLGFVVEFRQSFADRQDGSAHRFSLLGGTLGITAGF